MLFSIGTAGRKRIGILGCSTSTIGELERVWEHREQIKSHWDLTDLPKWKDWFCVHRNVSIGWFILCPNCSRGIGSVPREYLPASTPLWLPWESCFLNSDDIRAMTGVMHVGTYSYDVPIHVPPFPGHLGVFLWSLSRSRGDFYCRESGGFNITVIYMSGLSSCI
jgi:hypothetical protein